ncbi:helix-turn-helix domain-containing protein [Paenibacillus roseipurpureus]|uniref:Helix-turn-helix domain-containing protein n=1 Tax=Paenibacillus roseopurpureus TaxID=2918901 RepID=A0AA96LLI4_9BACL|nr:helix-turn-helix domain-containing protein [Paenibacillus sp. MBLB1832]WNR43306.1 helix-turn-helix domain-containing protein [Paenibacillus sp. MBLB1832]
MQFDEFHLLAGHFTETDTYVTKRPQGREDWLLTYTLGGEGFFRSLDQTHNCREGDFALVRPHAQQHYGTAPGAIWQFVWIHFPDSLTETSLLPDQPVLHMSIENDSLRERVHHAFMRILADSRERSDYWMELCIASVRELLLLLAQKSARKIDARIEEVQYLLSKMMRQPIRIDELAKAVGLSPSRLSHLFKESTGLSIIDSLNRMRIQQAVLLLQDSVRSASEVCYDVGFQNYNHFSNQFRKWYGESPSTFKKTRR